MTTYAGNLTGEGLRIGIVAGRFNGFITERLLAGALDCLQRHGTPADAVDVAWAPGSFEIPLIASRMAAMRRYDAIICLGAIIRGDTAHFDLVATAAANGVARVALDSDIPVIFGILTTESIEQAVERAGTKAGNKGFDAALSALEAANLLRSLASDE